MVLNDFDAVAQPFGVAKTSKPKKIKNHVPHAIHPLFTRNHDSIRTRDLYFT